jgi:hypothetical protein
MESMTPDHSNARPPQWAETLLRLLLKPQNRESVSGDLLEEYRDTIVPTLGPGADRWYVRQVGSFLLRASWVWGAVLGAALVTRYLFDTLAPPTNYRLRASALTYTAMAACLLAGFTGSLRTRSMGAGVLTSLTAATMGALFSIAGAGLMLAVWHDPATLDAWRTSGGLAEAFIDVPLKLIALGGVAVGGLGAVVGKGVARTLPAEMKTRHLR